MLLQGLMRTKSVHARLEASPGEGAGHPTPFAGETEVVGIVRAAGRHGGQFGDISIAADRHHSSFTSNRWRRASGIQSVLLRRWSRNGLTALGGIYYLIYIMQTAKLFKNGQSQAVRLPNEFRFEGDEVFVRKLGNTVILLPMDDPWRVLIDSLGEFSEDYLEERDQPAGQRRDDLD